MFSKVLRDPRSLVAPLAIAAVSVAATGCATQAASEGEEPSSTVEAVVHLERTATDEGASTSVSAKFMRLLPSDRATAERLVGTRVVLPAVGECAPASALSDTAGAKLKGTIELVDVGDLTLTARPTDGAQSDITLAPRAFPDVGDLASGVFYTSPDGTRDLPVPAKLTLRATGASAVEPFSIDLDAPAAPRNVRIGGRGFVGPFSDASSAPGDAPRIEGGREVTVEWDTTPSEAGDLVYVELHYAGSTREPVRCAFHDVGTATLPAALVPADVKGDVLATLSLHRLREQEVRHELADKQGAETMTIRFDLARSGRVVVTAPR
jgi:hypothetical protein